MNEYHDAAVAVESIGPFEEYRVTVNGFLLEGIQAKAHDDGMGMVEIILDNRLAYDVPHEVAGKVLALLADAVAIAKGFPCFPGPDRWEPKADCAGRAPAFVKFGPLTGYREIP